MFRFERDFPLRHCNTFGMDVTSRFYFEFTEEADLPGFLTRFGQWGTIPHLFMGGGSNLLFTRDYEGLLVQANVPGIRLIREDRNTVWLEAGAGENWDRLVSYCVNLNYGGLENLSLIPGNVGAAPVQNIGAYGTEVAGRIELVKGFDLQSFDFYEIPAGKCRFGYRDSVFKNELRGRFVVTSVVFRLDKFPELQLGYGDLRAEMEKLGGATIGDLRAAVIAIRRRKLPDPQVLGNAGSFFKNPVLPDALADELKARNPGLPVYRLENGYSKLAAGWLIEQCGWKGYREGDAGVHQNQALVLVNYGNAGGSQIAALSEKISESVRDRFSVVLEPEVLVI